MRIVVALGGNAPLAAEHELVITHGNGPQVGVLALQSANVPHLSTPYPSTFRAGDVSVQLMLSVSRSTAPGAESPRRDGVRDGSFRG
jgi:hypothetical protein